MLKKGFSSGEQLDIKVAGEITDFEKALFLQWAAYTEKILHSYDSRYAYSFSFKSNLLKPFKNLWVNMVGLWKYEILWKS